MKAKEQAGEEVARISQALQRLIHDQGLTYRVVEDRLEMGRDYLSQLLRGSVDLKLKHVMGILAAIGLPPAEFFAAAYGLMPPEVASRLEYETDAYRVDRLVMIDLVRVFEGKGLLTKEEAAGYIERLLMRPPEDPRSIDLPKPPFGKR